MAYEALNHGGAIDTDLLVILNDNEMSISPNVGAMSKYLSSIWSGKIYTSLRSGSKKVLKRIPSALELAKRAEEHVKGMVTPGTLFEELGFSYFGPIDGHNLGDLLSLIRNLQQLSSRWRSSSNCGSIIVSSRSAGIGVPSTIATAADGSSAPASPAQRRSTRPT